MSINLNPYWIAGFVTGEGSFIISISKKGKLVLTFSVGQTTSDQHVLWALWVYFGKNGNVNSSMSNVAELRISNSDGIRLLILFFDQYPILGNKSKDYFAWREVAIIKQRNEHYTSAGFARCVSLYAHQNTGRNYHDLGQRGKGIEVQGEQKSYGSPRVNTTSRQLML